MKNHIRPMFIQVIIIQREIILIIWGIPCEIFIKNIFLTGILFLEIFMKNEKKENFVKKKKKFKRKSYVKYFIYSRIISCLII